MEKIDPVDRDLADMIVSAKAGNTRDARAVIKILQGLLSNATDRRFPLSRIAADFLIEALDAGLRGESINKALGLTRRGRKNEWDWQAKAMSARIVQELMAHGVTLDVAAELAAEVIGERIKAREQGPAWASFQGRIPSDADCRRWYVELIQNGK